MDQYDLQREARRQRRLEYFLVDDPACHKCQEDEPYCLRRPDTCLADDYNTIWCWNCWCKYQELLLTPNVRQKRRASKLRKLGNKTPICITCFETALCTLELHHWLQRDFSPDVQVNCMNCHKLFSEAQYIHPCLKDTQRPKIALAVKAFHALADEYELCAKRRRKSLDRLRMHFCAQHADNGGGYLA